MELKNKIDDYLESGISFKIDCVAEVFPNPLSYVDDCGHTISNFGDILFSSYQFGFGEIFIPSNEEITGFVGKEEISISRRDFLAWQISRSTEIKVIYHLLNEFEAYSLGVLESYDPESWMCPYGVSEEEYDTGLDSIRHMLNQHPEELIDTLIEIILDENTGLLSSSGSEIEIDENLDDFREIYAKFPVPALMTVSRGDFDVYIDPEAFILRLRLREGWKVSKMMVRSYHENISSTGSSLSLLRRTPVRSLMSVFARPLTRMTRIFRG